MPLLLEAIERVNEQVVAASPLHSFQIKCLRDSKFPIRKEFTNLDLTTNWTPATRQQFDKWMTIAECIIDKLSSEELVSLDPHYGVLNFGLTYAASAFENVPVAMVRIICALATQYTALAPPLNDDVLVEFLTHLLRGNLVPPTPLLLNAGNASSYTQATASCFLLAGPNEMSPSNCSTGLTVINHTIELMTLIAKMSLNGGAIGLNMSMCSGGSGPGACLPTAALYSNILENYPKTNYRKATGTLFLEMWHVDVMDFIRLHHPQSIWMRRTDRVFPALWVNDAFMSAVQSNQTWYLFDPSLDARVGEMVFLYGDKFDKLYSQLVAEQVYTDSIPARDIFVQLAHTIIATGGPFVLFKDHINKTSSHTDIYGPITSSNLCTEIVQYHSPNEVATCNLISLNVERILCPQHALMETITVDNLDYTRLKEPVELAVRVTTFRTFIEPDLGSHVKNHSIKSRPIGIGIQGYTDLLHTIDVPYLESGPILRKIFEHMYYYALEASSDLVAEYGPFDKFYESYYAKGRLHFDAFEQTITSKSLDWTLLRYKIMKQGLANSLLIAQMPTSHSATTWNTSEWFEPLSRPVERKKTAVGDCIAIVKALRRDTLLCERIISELLVNGSQTHFESGWDMPIRKVLQVWNEAIPFIDQSASLSWYLNGGVSEVMDGLVFCWRKQFKTALYYMRIRPHGTNKQFLRFNHHEDDDTESESLDSAYNSNVSDELCTMKDCWSCQ